MINVIIGCDPDSSKHGIAIYINGKLKELFCVSTLALMDKLVEMQGNRDIKITMHIENLNGISSSAFKHNPKLTQPVKNKISEKVGKCKQAQLEVERVCEYLNIDVVHHKVSSMWKAGDSAKAFVRVTGWTKRCNEDARSAAWFGYLGSR